MKATKTVLLCVGLVLPLILFAASCGGGGELRVSKGDTTETAENDGAPYAVVDTNQTECYDNETRIAAPAPGQPFYGQDAQHDKDQPSYRDNGDGTVSDLNTGLMWQKDPGEKKTYSKAVAGADSFSLAGYDDWRLPSIKELYSLIMFSGIDPPAESTDTAGFTPFLDTRYFDFSYGDPAAGDRIIDSQWISSTRYTGTTMGGNETAFGVNFADGRIKGYPTGPMPGQSEEKGFYVIYVRGNTEYGENSFKDNNDGTVTDESSGLIWSKGDSGKGLDWEEALAWVQQRNAEDYLGHSDWRLPDVKELQSIVDYSRSPDATSSSAVDPVFICTQITNEAGQADWPCYWSSTTHVSTRGGGRAASYVAFGRAMGFMQGRWLDVHGAGAQRSDPKAGDPGEYPQGNGPQGDAIRIYNYVRPVRDA